jgi:tRNA-specific 2-thiouridylase
MIFKTTSSLESSVGKVVTRKPNSEICFRQNLIYPSWDRVVSETVTELKAGRTPSPDILCNQRVKFGAFTDHIDDSFDKIASGHYASILEKDGVSWLEKGNDPIKDQTYFLSHLSQNQLSRCVFPIGHFPKAKVRELAQHYNLPNKARKDSQGICFLGKIKYNDFVRIHLGEKKGEIRDITNERVLGNHKGFWFHTIGQRRGLGLGGGPWFVVRKDIDKNIIYVSSDMERMKNSRNDFVLGNPHWISEKPQYANITIKIRHGEKVTKASVKDRPDGMLDISLEESDSGIAAGQYAVLYQGDVCLGGGIIQ